MKEKEYNVVTLEDGVEYTEVSRLENNNNTYLFLSNLDKPEDFCIRKLIKRENNEYIVGLDSKEEFDKIFNLFSSKYIN